MKKVLVAAAAVALSVAAHASTTFSLGTVSGTTPLGNTVTGQFTDTYSFQVASASTGAAVALNASYLITGPGITLGKIADFAGSLDGNPLSLISTPVPYAPGVQQVNQTLSISSVALAVGAHSLKIWGTADAGSQYTGSLTVTPVPEPETYALMLAGLGAIGFLARRRSSI